MVLFSKKLVLFSKKYFIVPINHNLGSSDLFLLKAMEAVAKSKGYRNGKSYLKSVLGCSGTSVKNMTRSKEYRKSVEWDMDEYVTKDAYVYIRKLDIDKYAKAIDLVIAEYAKIASKSEREDLLEYTRKYRTQSSYQRALCYKSIDGLEVAIADSITSNRINKVTNANATAGDIRNALLGKEVDIG